MCKTPTVDLITRYNSYLDQQDFFYRRALIKFRGDHTKAFAVAVELIEQFIIADEMDPRDYWAWIDREATI